jgi:hypothetical protein
MSRLGDVLQPLFSQIGELGHNRAPRTCRQASAKMQMPPGNARLSSRAASLTP